MMKKMIKTTFNLLSKILSKKYLFKLDKLRLGYKMINDKDGYLIKTGYIDSKINNTLKVNGEYVPWFNFSFIEILKHKLKNDLTVFEYGSGASTLFFSNRCKQVTSIEHDKNWFSEIKTLTKDNLNTELHFFKLDKSYPNSINEIHPDKKYDVIIVDGRMRNECCLAIKNKLKPKSVVILDDSHRDKYKEGVSFLLSLGFAVLNFKGLKPLGYKIDQTSLFYKPGNNCLEL